MDPVDGGEEGRAAIGRGNPVSINIASGYDAIWLMTDRELLRVHPGTREVRAVASLQRGPVISWTADVTIGAGYVWVGTSDGELLRFDPRTSDVARTKRLPPIDAIAAGSGVLWTSNVLEGTVTWFDPETMEPAGSVEIQGGADIMETDGSDLWVLTQSAGLVTPVFGGEKGAQIRVGDDPTSMAFGLGAIWVGDEDGIIRRIDRETRQVEELSVGAPIRAIGVNEEENTLWVDVR